jgi:hypothetical protein
MKVRMGAADADHSAAARAKDQLEKVRQRRRELQGRARELGAQLKARVREETEHARRTMAVSEAVEKFREKFVRDYDRKVRRTTKKKAGRRKKKVAAG